MGNEQCLYQNSLCSCCQHSYCSRKQLKWYLWFLVPESTSFKLCQNTAHWSTVLLFSVVGKNLNKALTDHCLPCSYNNLLAANVKEKFWTRWTSTLIWYSYTSALIKLLSHKATSGWWSYFRCETKPKSWPSLFGKTML